MNVMVTGGSCLNTLFYQSQNTPTANAIRKLQVIKRRISLLLACSRRLHSRIRVGLFFALNFNRQA